jgi:hypothetical protein
MTQINIALTLTLCLFNLAAQSVNLALLSLKHQSPLGVDSLA